MRVKELNFKYTRNLTKELNLKYNRDIYYLIFIFIFCFLSVF